MRNGRVAAAYLFIGPPDSGKKEAAEEFAQRLGCNRVDYFVLKPSGASLKIEQIRELQQLIRYGPSASKYFVVVIEEADTMSPEAAAAFLKTLEEPPLGVVFILLVERQEKIPETVVSRCQKIIFSEKLITWQPNQEWETFREELRNVKKMNSLELFEFSSRLEKEKERIEELLYELINFSRYELENLKFARILLDAVKNIKKKANLRLVLDVACVELTEA